MNERANYQGEHVGLRLNLEAVEALRAALDGVCSGYGRGYREVPLRLPDGRTVQLAVSLTSDGEFRNEHGDYVGDDGLAHGDVMGDLRAHVDADNAIREACAWPLLTTAQLDGTEPVDVEALATARTDAALDRLSGRYEYERRPEWLAGVRDRALAAARERLPEQIAHSQEGWRRVEAQQAAERACEPGLSM